ncbi:unnamed protein product [Ectocarpus fasciculatus]
MASFNPQEWTPGFDEHGVNCWFNKTTRGRVYGRFPPQMQVGLSPIVGGPGVNVPTSTQFNPASALDAEKLWKQALAGAWREYEDEHEKKPYWHNEVSGARTWEKPDTSGAQKPPPPSTPPPRPPPSASHQPQEPSPHKDNGGKAGGAGEKKKKESEQWKELRTAKGRKYWYNEDTGASQYETPICRRKYR